MSWLTKLLPPKIKREQGQRRSNLPEGLWSKCPSCEAVLYATDLENNLQVCPKCGHHNRLNSRQRLDLLLDTEGRFEIGAEVVPVDSLKFKDSKKYPDRLMEANEATGESDSLVVMQGAIKTMPVVAAAFEFEFMGGSMGSVLGERFVRGVQNAVEQKMPFICITASGGARMQEGLFCSTAFCTPRTKRSPSTEPIEPPMKSNSKAATTTGRALSVPCMTTIESDSPVLAAASTRRSE